MADGFMGLQPTLSLPVLLRPVRAPEPQKITASGGAGGARNDGLGQRPQTSTQSHRGAVLQPPPDRDRPTGPPPAFEANVLEAEAERYRNPDKQVAPRQSGRFLPPELAAYQGDPGEAETRQQFESFS
ncbi:MAG: hypothetical protein KDE03_07700 [Rhodobacteraceae bacterium]|nr:hypothetical protein [Paracoccaceae bacterium]